MTGPVCLAEVVGNGPAIRLLTRGRIPQSAILSGPEGIGKRTTARLVAAFANCRNRIDGDLCGRCIACLKAASSNHPDIWEFPPEGDTSVKIEHIRELNREAQFRPFEGIARFFLIDRAERLTEDAANCLLKTLEEPPPTSHIFLITAFPELLLPTIRSRCQTIRFRPLTPGEITSFLRARTDLDRPEIRARFSNGSLGEAIDLNLEELLLSRDQLLGLLETWVDDPRFCPIFEFSENKGTAGGLKSRETTLHLLRLLQSLAYDLYYLQAGTPDRMVNLDRGPRLERLAEKVPPHLTRNLLRSAAEAVRDVDRNVGSQICFETLWLRLEADSDRN